MKKIYKYDLPITGSTTHILAPIEKILTVQMQNSIPVMWAMVDLDKEDTDWYIAAVGTGWDISGEPLEEYIGTVQDDMGYVWHYFTLDVPELQKAYGLSEVAKSVGMSAEEAQACLEALCKVLKGEN